MVTPLHSPGNLYTDCSSGYHGGVSYVVEPIEGVNFYNVETYDISGVVFLDANENGVLDAGEPRFPGTTVTLSGTDLAGDDWEMTLVSGAGGKYEFTGLPPGTCTVTVSLATPDNDADLNEMLEHYFDETTLRPITVSVGPDSTGNDFGYAVDTTALIIELPEYDGTGKTIGFWKHQFSAHLKANKKVNAHVDAETLMGYLDAINDFGPEEPFHFSDDRDTAFQQAFDIMSANTKDDVGLLLKQLLATELNHMAAQGLQDDLVLQGFLLEWGECIASHPDEFDRDQTLEAKDIFDLINNSGE